MRAGQNIRHLAGRRRWAAARLWSSAGLLVTLPLVLLAQGAMLPLWAYGLCLVLAAGLVWQGRSRWQQAHHAAQGAAAEVDIATVLGGLIAQHWQVEYGVQHPSIGDVDILLRSPRGQVYAIDVKSHQGTVRSEQDTLYRYYGQTRYPFEKDFLKQVKHQAVVMRDLKQVRYVTPILVFANATVEVAANPVAGVYVLAKAQLLPCLQTLG
jgi:Nuclease-related domain